MNGICLTLTMTKKTNFLLRKCWKMRRKWIWWFLKSRHLFLAPQQRKWKCLVLPFARAHTWHGSARRMLEAAHTLSESARWTFDIRSSNFKQNCVKGKEERVTVAMEFQLLGIRRQNIEQGPWPGTSYLKSFPVCVCVRVYVWKSKSKSKIKWPGVASQLLHLRQSWGLCLSLSRLMCRLQ